MNKQNHKSPFSEVTNCRSFSKERASPYSNKVSKNLQKSFNCDPPVCINLSKESSKPNNNSIANSQKLAVSSVRKSLPTVDIIEKINMIPSKTKKIENYPIFATEKKKRFPSSTKSIFEYLFDFCHIMEDIKLDFDKSSLISSIDGRIFDMMESHYPMGQIFYLQESLKIMDSTFYKKKEGKFDLFDIYVQFDKTFNFYLKYGQKNDMVEDFNYHFNSFNKYLRTTGLSLDIEKIKNNEAEMDIAQDFWKKIVCLNERVLKNLIKETNHSDASQLNYLFIDIAKQMLEIFIHEIYQPKFFKNKNDLADYFNINEDFFNLLLVTFDTIVIENVKANL
jgi:hypothetical protein